MSDRKVDENEPMNVDDRRICFCHNVNKSKICEVIANGATTLEEIQDQTCASTGCGGCEFEVRDLLEEELSKKKKTA